ncbi:hypothetical protein BH09BAC1_BH09BAC1_28130 [soil metagenome]
MRMRSITASLFATLTGHTSSIYSLVGDGSNIYTTGGDGQVVKWPLEQDAQGTLISRMGMQIFSMALLRDKQQMLLGQMQGGIHVVDLQAKQESRHLALHKNGVFDMLPVDGHFLAAGGDGVLSYWREDDYSLGKTISLSDNSLRALAVHPDGKTVAVGSSDNGIYLLSYPSLEIMTRLDGHENSVFTVSFSPDGRYLLSGSRDAHFMVWDVLLAYTPIHRIAAHLFTINHLVYSPDGKLFATAGRDKDIKLWDAETFELLKVLDRHKFDGHINSVNRLHWGEQYLVSASDDRTIKLWEVA